MDKESWEVVRRVWEIFSERHNFFISGRNTHKSKKELNRSEYIITPST